MPNGGHDEVGKHQIQASIIFNNQIQHTSHEPDIVADQQLDKPLVEHHSSVTPNASALSPEFIEIDDDPDDIFAFV